MPLINHAGGGGGTPQLCPQIENFVVIPGALSATLKWTAPDPDEDSSFVGVRIVRKAGSAPEKVSDGTVVYEGTALTYTDTGLTAGTTYYYRAFAYNAKKKYQTAKKIVKLIAMTSVSFSSMSWDEIGALSRMGVANSVFSVGDTKSLVINGTVGTTTFSNKEVSAFILGFNHNAAIEGGNLIHLMLWKNPLSGVGYTLEGSFQMSPSNASRQGWVSTNLRTTVLGGDSTPIAPKANTLMAALPAELRQVMRPALKYANNTFTYSTNDTSPYTAIQEYLTEPSLNEVLGIDRMPSYSMSDILDTLNPAEFTYMQQYDYFKAGNSAQTVMERDDTTVAPYWSRTPDTGNSTTQQAYYFPLGYSSLAYGVGVNGVKNIRPIFFV